MLTDSTDSRAPALPSRYQILGELGRGGMAVVYHAYDTASQRPVAIKFLPPTEDENALRRFRREAADLAAVFHPNIVDFYAMGESQGQEYIEMEYVSGGSLSGYLRSGPPLHDVLVLFMGVCDGLEHIHNKGLVHRDLKPANVLISADGVPKLADLGLARRMEGRSQLTQTGAIVGTCSYLAPEQLTSIEVGPRADLYALGVCLYEAVTGRHPYNAESQMALLRAHLEEKAALPSTLRPGLPRRLDSLIMRLLEKNPDHRPATAARVGAELQACIAELGVTSPPSDTLPGRGQDLQRLAAERGGYLLVAPAEVGRSRLLAELGARLRASSVNVFELGPSDALTGLLAALGVRPERPTDPACLAGALRRGLQNKTGVLLADDFERLDSLTQDTLEHLARLTPPAGSGWVVSATQSQAYAFPQGAGGTRVEAGPLAGPDLAALARLELKAEPGRVLEEWLLPRAGGSPRQLKLLLFALRSAGLLETRDGRAEVGHPARLPTNLTEAILSAVEGLEEDARLLLQLGCLLQEPFSFELLCRASGLSEERADRAAAVLTGHGLLEEGRKERFRVGPTGIRQRLAAGLSDRLGRRHHARIAEALQELKGPVGQRGRHLALAGQVEEAAPLLMQGAAEAHDRGLYPEALELWETVPQGHPGLLEARARTLIAMGRFEEAEPGLDGLALVDLKMARRQWDEAYTLCKRGSGPEFDLRLSTVLAHQGNRPEAVAALERALPGVAPAERLRLGRLYLEQGNPARARTTVEVLLDRPEFRGEALVLLAEALQASGRGSAARERLQQAAALAADEGRPEWEARVRLRLTARCHAEGDLESAALACEQAVALLRPAGESPILVDALEQLGRVRQAQGREREAEQLFAECVQVGDVTVDGPARARARLSLGRFQLEAGRAASAVEWLSEAARLAESSDSRELLAEALAELASAHRLEGGTDAGLKAAERAVEEARRVGACEPLGRALVALGEVCVDRQKWKSALEALQEARGLLPSGNRGLQVRLLEALSRLHEEGARQEYPGLSAQEAERHRQIARGLRERDRKGSCSSPAVTRRLSGFTSTLRSGSRRVLPWLAGAAVLALALVVAMYALRPRVGVLQVQSDPANAVVLIDGVRHAAPCSLELEPGHYEVKLHQQGYKPHQETVELVAGQTFKLMARLESASGGVKLDTKPAGAKVFVEGQSKGLTPLELKGLPPKRYTVKVVKQGYKDYKGAVDVVAGQTRNLTVALEKLPPPPPPRPAYTPEPYYDPPSYSGGGGGGG
ncbi:MAG: protein kinase, partial [Candidatus Eremiobacterota bacterium]